MYGQATTDLTKKTVDLDGGEIAGNIGDVRCDDASQLFLTEQDVHADGVVTVPFNNGAYYKVALDNSQNTAGDDAHYHIKSVKATIDKYEDGSLKSTETVYTYSNSEYNASYSNRLAINGVETKDFIYMKFPGIGNVGKVSAVFEPDVYQVKFDLNGHGTDAPDDQYIVYKDTVDESKATASASDAVFLGWYDNAAGTGDPYDFSTPVDHDFTLYAKWMSMGQLSIEKIDAEFDNVYETGPQGNGTLSGAVFQVINSTGGNVYVAKDPTSEVNPTDMSKYKSVANGGVCFTFTTGADGTYKSGKYALQSGTYTIREVTPPAGYNATADVTVKITASSV